MKISTSCAIFVCIAQLICALPAHAQFLMNGTGDPTVAPNNFEVDQTGTSGFTFDSNDGTANSAPGFLHQEAGNPGNYQTTTSPLLVEPDGYFAEARYQVISNQTADSLLAATFWVQSGAGRYLLGLGEQSQGILINEGSGSAAYTDPGPFHTIRVECAPGCTAPSVILDGVDLGNAAISGAVGDKVGFGDHSGQEAEVVWDYVVVNQEIPEPTSAFLLATAILGLAVYGRRRNRS